MKSIYHTLWASFSRVDTKRVYLYSLIIGVLAGIGALAFYWCLAAATHATYGWIAQIEVPQPGDGESYFGEVVGEPRRWVFFFMPAIGGLIAGWLLYKFAPEGTGTEGFLDAFHNKGGMMNRRSGFVEWLATIFTLASGGSAGKEGPIAQVGACFGAIMGKWLKVGERARRTLLLAGMAGGLGAIFRAPLGGTFTAIEVLYKEDFETDALIPCLMSSVMAYTVFCSVMGFHHIFTVELTGFQNPMQLIFYVILGFACSGVGYLYIKFFRGIKDHFFAKLNVPRYALPAIGGLMVGVIGFFEPRVTGASLGYIQQAMEGQMDFGVEWQTVTRVFIMLAILKILATSFTIQSGGSGGIFGPTLFIGGMLGGVVGTVSNYCFPEVVPDVTPFIVVGMASFFAGVASAPIASIVMVSELTGGYQLLPALMIVAAISLIFSRGTTIYRHQVLNKFASKAHLWDMNPYVLAKIALKTAFKSGYRHHAVINVNDTYTHVEQLAAKIHETDFVVKDENDRFVGAFSLKDTHFIQDIAEAKKLLVVTDLVSTKVPFVTPDDTLFVAMERLLDSDFDKIAVVEDPDDARKLLGYVRQREILAVYRSTHAVANLSARP